MPKTAYLKGRHLARISEILETAQTMNAELAGFPDPDNIDLLVKRLDHLQTYIDLLRIDVENDFA
jgi:hypothetical protein